MILILNLSTNVIYNKSNRIYKRLLHKLIEFTRFLIMVWVNINVAIFILDYFWIIIIVKYFDVV